MDVVKDCIDPNATPPDFFFDYGLWIPGPTWYPEKDQRYIDVYEDDDSLGGGGSPEEEPESEGESAVPPVVEEKAAAKFKEIGSGKKELSAEEAGQVARELGFAPSEADIEKLKSETNDKVTFEAQQKFLSSVTHKEDSTDHLIKFFAHFDVEQSGFLSKQRCANLLANYGEPLRQDCIDCVLKDQPDPVNYRDFVTTLLQR